MRSHALLGPSSAHRWMHCTPSAKLESTRPDTAGKDAEVGTLAHAIVEERLSRVIKGKSRGKTSAKLAKNPLYFEGMDDYCDQYVDFVVQLYDSLKEKHPVMFSEQKVDFSEWVPDGFGTTDTVIIADGVMYVIDFKFGKGVRVDAKENPQLRLYALGAYNDYSILYDIDVVTTYIVQPRIEDGITSETLRVTTLLDWAENEVKPKADLAIRGAGEAVEGDWCRFCRARDVCKPRAVAFLEHLKDTYQNSMELTPDELARLLPIAEHIQDWAKELKNYMSDQAINNGVTFHGYKVVAGRSTRVIDDPAALANALQGAGYQDIYKLKDLTDLENMVGKNKFAKLSEGLISKPDGKPTLVPVSDKRPEYVLFDDDDD